MPSEHIDTRLLEELTEQSQDLASDALRITRGALLDFGQAVEDQAAQTDVFATYNDVTSPGGIATAATLAPVEAMHAAVLDHVLGRRPVPDDFLPVAKAAGPTLLTV
ncbi:hypothetical protein AB0A71_17650 [Kitasatospora aureofaciens]|uniref:hypothetical protein n=1 Tax=Kitasatospora aureofaciens TaxID=1894 RepID=UPI0033C2BB9A